MVKKDRENYCSLFAVNTPQSPWKQDKEKAGDEPKTESGAYTDLQHRDQLAAVCAVEDSENRTSFSASLRGTAISCHAD